MMDNIDKNDASGFLVPVANEDSVDIYDGLDISSSGNAVMSSPTASQLKESMDLYEEIVLEEQQNRESSFSELKSRFQTAQNQIVELRRRLEQIELQVDLDQGSRKSFAALVEACVLNTGLNTENYRLKKNISALLRTARLEVSRKDAEIQRLTQQSDKGRYHHQPHINNLQDHNLFSRSSTVSSKSRPRPPTPSIILPPPPSTSTPPPPPSSGSLPPVPALPLREDCLPRETLQPYSKESDSSTYQAFIETKAAKASSHSHSKMSLIKDCDVPDKQTEHFAIKSSSCSAARHSESDKHKYKHKENRCSESTDRRHRTDSGPNKDCYASEKSRCHKADRGTGQRRDSRSYKSRDYLNDEVHHKSERAKRPPPEILDYASSSDKKGKNQEQRQDKAKLSTADSEDSTAHSSKEGYSQNHKKSSSHDRHNRNADSKDREKYSSIQHECHSDASKERTGDRLSKDYHRKEDRRHDESCKKHKRSTLSEKSKEHKKQKSKESTQGKEDACSKERKEKTKEAPKKSSKKTDMEEISVKGNSPNRKLCFMETLNLTLSPIKKSVLPIDVSQVDITSLDEVIKNGPDDCVSSQPDIEDMCVIDEVDSSELETGLEDVAKQSSDVSKTPGPEKTQRCDEKDKNQSEPPVTNQQLEHCPVQTTSTLHLDTAEIQMAVHVTNKLPESTSLKASNGDVSKNEEKTKLTSDIQAEECGSLGATDGMTDTSRSPPKTPTSKSFQKVNLGNISDQSTSEPIVHDSNVQLKCRTLKTAAYGSLPVDSDKEGTHPSPSRENPVVEDVPAKGQCREMTSAVPPQHHQQGLAPPPVCSSIHERESNAVSSTISLESLPQEGLSLPEAIYILTQTIEDTSNSSSITTEPSSSTGCIAVSKVSSTTEESALSRDFTITPKKSFSPAKSHKNRHEPSSSVQLLHDEDSMMRTLSNLKRIPDAISPLRSPIRIMKRSHLHAHVKPGHVKSLEKDFSSTAVDVNLKKLDVNKENNYPGSPENHDMQDFMDKVSDLPSSLSDTEVEEGEIISESDETASSSPLPATKRAKLARPIRNKPSPKTLIKRTSKETNETAGVSTRSPKSRFKTVCPAATKASFSTIEEVMETFKLVRAEIRKKYMKLHKTFPKKSFYGVMNHFRESFLEFVDGADFDQISSQQGELKSKLKKLIASVFSKVSNNGIVKRIFEQQAIDLKQKLWDFVDAQVDYLFRDIYMVLKSLYIRRAQGEDNKSSEKELISIQPPANKPQVQQKETHSLLTNPNQLQACSVVPYKTGLGSRGKDIRITHVEKDKNVDQQPNTQTVVNLSPPKYTPSTPEKKNISSLVVSQNVSLLDKTDFELLTEQQASSLTFNLVRDSQMGEIFKCLLQGSDLLETSTITGDNTVWSLGTPRKDGERFISITTPTKFDSPSKLLSPTKFDTPSKPIATWSSISPRKMLSPGSKGQVPLNPALFDESCLLEVPSENRAMLHSNLTPQKTYSFLAEDLAVSLTIPSPLKSDSHLSFLQPPGMHVMSTPDSVISAHISEDALLDGEDATEQDIHLALDTDNSSGDSSNTVSSEVLATPFGFKPDLPMQALVMEKSNDHFIVKICQAAKGTDTTLIANDSLSQTLTEQNGEHSVATQESQVLSDKVQDSFPSNAVLSVNKLSDRAERVGISQTATGSDIQLPEDESSTLIQDPPHKEEGSSTQQNTSNVCFTEGLMEDFQKLSGSVQNLPETTLLENSFHNSPQSSDKFLAPISQATSRERTTVTDDESTPIRHREEDMTASKGPSKALYSESGNSPHHSVESSGTVQRSREFASDTSHPKRCEVEVSDSQRSFSNEKEVKCCSPETDQRERGKSGKRKKHQEKWKAKRSRREEEESTEEIESHCKNNSEPKSSPASASNSSLYAKNVIRKKGEVVMAWTRDEDRAILIELKTKGASRETFSVLSEKLNKPSGQIAQRFYQLMKLYKKMDT